LLAWANLEFLGASRAGSNPARDPLGRTLGSGFESPGEPPRGRILRGRATRQCADSRSAMSAKCARLDSSVRSIGRYSPRVRRQSIP